MLHMENMDHLDILRKAVTKAKKNGYFLAIDMDTMLFNGKEVICRDDVITSKDFLKGSFSYCRIIFNHDFAKSFWGADWQQHLQNMVILREPLEYLTKFI